MGVPARSTSGDPPAGRSRRSSRPGESSSGTLGLRVVCLLRSSFPEPVSLLANTTDSVLLDLQDLKRQKVTQPLGTNRQAPFSSFSQPPALPASAATLLILVTCDLGVGTGHWKAPYSTARFEFLKVEFRSRPFLESP